MTDIEIYQENGIQKTNSKNVASVFEKPHRTVLSDIKKLDCSDGFREQHFMLSSYTSSQNKELPCIEMTEKGFYFLALGYTGKKAAQFKEAYISEFDRMANTLNSISDRVNKLSIEGKQIKELGAEWSRLGHEVNRFKKKHKEASNSLMSEVQLKLEI